MPKGISTGTKVQWTDDLKKTFLKLHFVDKLTDEQIAEKMNLRRNQISGIKVRLAEGKLDALKKEVVPETASVAPVKPVSAPAPAKPSPAKK